MTYPLPSPGSDASFLSESALWRDLLTMIREWKQGKFTAGSRSKRRGYIQIENGAGRDIEPGEFMQITSMTQPADTSLGIATNYSPILTATEPTWHSAIDNIVISDGPVADGEFFAYQPRTFGVVSCTGSKGSDLRYVMIDPANPQYGIRCSSGLYRVLGYDSTNDFAIVDLGKSQPLWRYKLTEASLAPSTTTAKLYTLDGTEYSTTTVELSDPLSIGDGDALDYEGYCVHVGNAFHIAPGPC